MTEPNPLAKGNALENAVQAIERTILSQAPGFKEGTFRIEGKKILKVDGVHHEIDVHVSAALPAAYDAVFIFECKNWEQKVPKNEIIVFSEKIRASNAQRGFFVAKTFTKDAVAQAALDQRMVLLSAAELDLATLAIPAGFHGIHLGDTKADVALMAPGATFDSHPRTPIDIAGATFVLDGQETSLHDFVQVFINRLRNESSNKINSGAMTEGVHVLAFAGDHEFAEGQATVNGKPLGKLHAAGTVEVHISRAVVVSAYEVATRGRHVTVQLTLPIGQIVAEFIQLAT